MDLTVRRRQQDPTPPLPLPSSPLPRVPDRTPPTSTPTGPPKAPPTGSPPEQTLQPANHPPKATTAPTATTVEGITALPHQACFPPAQTADPQGDRPCPGERVPDGPDTGRSSGPAPGNAFVSMSGPRGHLGPGNRNRPPNPPRTVPGLSDRQPTAEPRSGTP
jgi:hypothetical protein